MLIRQSLPQLLLLLSSIGRYASDKFLFTFKALHPLPLSLSNSTPSASSLLRFDIYVYEYFSELDVRARFFFTSHIVLRSPHQSAPTKRLFSEHKL